MLNTLYLFTRTKTYFLNLASDPVSSPHASFIKRPRTPHRTASDDLAPNRSSVALVGTFIVACAAALWRGIVVSTRFLLNLSPPKARPPQPWEEDERVQQLEVWTPGELEMALFGIYSPVHSMLWMATTSANWVLMLFAMFIVSVQVRMPPSSPQPVRLLTFCTSQSRAMTRSYEALVKDRAIIAAEVLHEYDEKVSAQPASFRVRGVAQIFPPLRSLSTRVSIPSGRTRPS